MKTLYTSRLKDAIYGFAVGDALGVPFEFKKRDTFDLIRSDLNKGLPGWGTWNQPPGTWSDDTSMVLATCDTIKYCGTLDLHEMMNAFCEWYQNGAYTPHGKTFDIGNTTRAALEKYLAWNRSLPPECCGGANIMDNGNGSLMRILPLAFTDASDDEIRAVSQMTHAHEISVETCVKFVKFVRELLSFYESRETPMWKRQNHLDKLIRHHFGDDKIFTPRDLVKSTGYVVATLEAVIWCLYDGMGYADCVMNAVELGGDTDTIAALVGGVAGVAYGYDNIPKVWIKDLANKELIDECIDW